jgi:protein TonB
MKHPAPRRRRGASLVRRGLNRVLAPLGGAALALACFLVLPLMQTISKPPEEDWVVRTVDTGNVPPPPPPPQEEPEKERPPDEKPPELAEETPPLDLAQLELALNPGGFSEGWGGIDSAVSLQLETAASAGNLKEIFAITDLDQKPRALYQPSPVVNPKMRERAPGTVYIIFLVDPRGRVESPRVQQSSDPVFEAAALAAVKQWKFEPGKRHGQPVRFRMRVPMTFPKGR